MTWPCEQWRMVLPPAASPFPNMLSHPLEHCLAVSHLAVSNPSSLCWYNRKASCWHVASLAWLLERLYYREQLTYTFQVVSSHPDKAGHPASSPSVSSFSSSFHSNSAHLYSAFLVAMCAGRPHFPSLDPILLQSLKSAYLVGSFFVLTKLHAPQNDLPHYIAVS